MKKGSTPINFVLLAVVTILSISTLGHCSDLESNLINRLLWNYQKYARPVSDPQFATKSKHHTHIETDYRSR